MNNRKSDIGVYRRRDLDYVKGFAIILLIFTHCVSGESYVKTWAFSFHMPIFFIICGILHGFKHQNGIQSQEIKQFIVHRCKQLLIPYFVFGMILIAFFQILRTLGGEPLNIGEQLFRLLTLQGIESMWFIPCYMIAEVLFVFFYVKLPDVLRFIVSCCFIGVLGYINSIGMPEFWVLRSGIKILISLIFIYVGFLSEKYKIISNIPIIITMVIMGMCSILGSVNGFVAIGALQLQNMGLFFLNAIGMSLAILSFFKWVDKTDIRLRLLEAFGKNSIVVLCTNNILIEIVRLVDYKLVGNILIRWEMFGNILFTVILIGMELIIIRGANGSLAPVFGKKRMS